MAINIQALLTIIKAIILFLTCHNETIKNVFNFNDIITTRGTAKEKGTGIGLTICKELIEKNHGELNIHSEAEKGTRVSFSLPLNDT